MLTYGSWLVVPDGLYWDVAADTEEADRRFGVIKDGDDTLNDVVLDG